jgi:hypothetical protein
MRHLVRLVTPPGGTVLDCFLGSGSTAIAAELEGFPWLGIEKEPEYVAIAEARLNGTQRGLGLDVPAPTQARTPTDSQPIDRPEGAVRFSGKAFDNRQTFTTGAYTSPGYGQPKPKPEPVTPAPGLFDPEEAA